MFDGAHKVVQQENFFLNAWTMLRAKYVYKESNVRVPMY